MGTDDSTCTEVAHTWQRWGRLCSLSPAKSEEASFCGGMGVNQCTWHEWSAYVWGYRVTQQQPRTAAQLETEILQKWTPIPRCDNYYPYFQNYKNIFKFYGSVTGMKLLTQTNKLIAFPFSLYEDRLILSFTFTFTPSAFYFKLIYFPPSFRNIHLSHLLLWPWVFRPLSELKAA